VKLALLTELNRRRATREAVIAITDLASGAARLVSPVEAAGDPLAEALAEGFRSGRSGSIEAAGGKFFLNVHLPPVKLIMIGAVHISQALAEMAPVTGLDCVIVDPRTAFATPERFPKVTVLAQWPDQALPGLSVDRYTALVALTHDPKIDDPALDHALKRECFYIGALGSRKTHAGRLARLAALGHTEAALARIHAPIGLDIGAVSPAEIAVSILAEIIGAMRAKRRG
jgi:xanthine dehydrogenase accessory factor